jgi:hypothetical protein
MDCPPIVSNLECTYDRDQDTVYTYCAADRGTYEITCAYAYQETLPYLRVTGEILFESNRNSRVFYGYQHSYKLPQHWECISILPEGICIEDGVLTAEYNTEIVEAFATAMIFIDWEISMKPVSDINSDGIVNAEDLGILLSDWGVSGAGDLNDDGIVDGVDLGILQVQWGEGW